MTEIIIEKEDVNRIRLVGTNIPYNVKEDSVMFGKTFNRYVAKGQVFVLPSDDPFNKDKADGKVQRVFLIEDDDERIKFDGYVNDTQVIRQRNFEKALKVLEETEMSLDEALAFA